MAGKKGMIWKRPFITNNPKQSRRWARKKMIKEVGEISKDYDVHHVDFSPFNNAIENLKILSDSVHGKLHHPKKAQKVDAITKRLWAQLEKELKDLYEYLDRMAPPKEEKEDNDNTN